MFLVTYKCKFLVNEGKELKTLSNSDFCSLSNDLDVLNFLRRLDKLGEVSTTIFLQRSSPALSSKGICCVGAGLIKGVIPLPVYNVERNTRLAVIILLLVKKPLSELAPR